MPASDEVKAFLGIDTSCYVTSVALVNAQGDVLLHGRTKLPVKQGELGLRQSEAVFAHIRQLPPLVQRAFALVREQQLLLCAVGVSDAPRRMQGSYMPVFVAGVSQAQGLCAAADVPLYAFSHQQGHLRAAEIGQQMPPEYLAVHLSGGTSEVLCVHRDSWNVEILGGTQDISAGQCIDRMGVLLGLSFPAGPELETLANKAQGETAPIGIPVQFSSFHFSGAEAEIKRRLARGEDAAQLARTLFLSIARALAKAICQAYEKTGLKHVLVGGGVAANRIVAQELARQLQKRCRAVHLHMADPRYAGDNAVGTALLAKEMEERDAQ